MTSRDSGAGRDAYVSEYAFKSICHDFEWILPVLNLFPAICIGSDKEFGATKLPLDHMHQLVKVMRFIPEHFVA